MVIISMYDRIIKNYRKKLTVSLPCSRTEKESIISSIEVNIRTYLDENPNASEKEIYDHFGTPDEIINDYLSSTRGSELQKKFKKKKTIFCIVFAGVLAVCLIVAAIVTVAFNHAMQRFPKERYVVSETTENSTLTEDWTSSNTIVV